MWSQVRPSKRVLKSANAATENLLLCTVRDNLKRGNHEQCLACSASVNVVKKSANRLCLLFLTFA